MNKLGKRNTTVINDEQDTEAMSIVATTVANENNHQVVMTPGKTANLPRVTPTVANGDNEGSNPNPTVFIEVRDRMFVFRIISRIHS